MCLYLAQWYFICNYNIGFYIKYSDLLSFELLKYSKLLRPLLWWLNTVVWKPFQKILAMPLIILFSWHIIYCEVISTVSNCWYLCPTVWRCDFPKTRVKVKSKVTTKKWWCQSFMITDFIKMIGSSIIALLATYVILLPWNF